MTCTRKWRRAAITVHCAGTVEPVKSRAGATIAGRCTHCGKVYAADTIENHEARR